MFEFVTQHHFALIVMVLLLMTLTACAARQHWHPAAVSKMDSAAYDVLLIAEATIDEARRQFATAAEIPVVVKEPLNALIASYNVARSAWLTYRGAVASNVPAQEYYATLSANLASLSDAIRKLKEVQ